MNPPQVLIERSALQALCVPSNEHHQRVAEAYLALVEEYEAERVLLVAVSDHLRPYRSWKQLRRRGPLAVIDVLHVGNQHRRNAARVSAADDFEIALTLVMCERHKVARMLTTDTRFTHYEGIDVQLIGAEMLENGGDA